MRLYFSNKIIAEIGDLTVVFLHLNREQHNQIVNSLTGDFF